MNSDDLIRRCANCGASLDLRRSPERCQFCGSPLSPEGDILARSLRIETANDVATPLLPKGTALPASVVEIFTTAVDNQPAVAIHLLEGDDERVEGCRNLGRFELGGISPQPRGAAQIRFNLEVSNGGRMNIEVEELGRDNRKSMEGPRLHVSRH